MNLCDITGTLAETIAVVLIILCISVIIVFLHCGSEYLQKNKHKTLSSHQEADRLREESEKTFGITRHSIFYEFIFRKN